jgi:hypothetical protein
MAIDFVTLSPWTRKHDDPRINLIPKAPRIVYPRSLAELIQLCRERPAGQRFRAAGSHWALSQAAISDHTFIETHDPRNVHQAMGKTLHEVIPGCMSDEILHALGKTPKDQTATSFIHVEAGKRIYQLYAELDTPDDLSNDETLAGLLNKRFGNHAFAKSWAFQTLGGAGGQTVVGALNTGTHGGDFRLPPIADSVVALHLVADGGRQYWIEPSPRLEVVEPHLVDAKKLTALYDKAVLGGPGNFEIIRDNAVFNAVLVSAGRFGIIYSVVLRAVAQYMLHERRKLADWQDVKSQIRDLHGPLYTEPDLGADQARFLQVAVCLTPHHNFQRNLTGITKRWKVLLPDAPQGRKECVGPIVDTFDQMIQAPRFANAGTTHGYSPDDDNPQQAADPTLLERACADASFLRGIIVGVIDDIEQFVASNGAEVGGGLAAVAVAGGAGLAAMFPALLLLLLILKEILEHMDGDDRFGEFMEGVKNSLLDPNEKDSLKRAAGLLVWQMIMYKAFENQQKEHDYDAISYAMMDRHDYLNISCEVNVDSVEVFFDAVDDRLIAFVDALIAYEIMQEFKGLAFAGYASLRFIGPSRALLGMQKHQVTCAVEISCLKDISGGQQVVDYAATLARNPNFNGLLHWGQHNDYTMADVEHRYGDSVTAPGGDLGTWREALGRVTDNGRLDGFSTEFTRRTGLEVVRPRIQEFTVDRHAVSTGDTITLKWNCLSNPPESRVSILLSRPTAGPSLINTVPLAGQHQIQVTEPGTHFVNFSVMRTLNGVPRQDSRTAFITVS